MALQSKVIKTKVIAVGNVKKITKAMERVSAVKMRRAVKSTLSAREYAYYTYELLASLLGHTHITHEFFDNKPANKVLLMAISSNKGLCGGLNTQLGRTIAEHVANHRENFYEVVAVGKKMEKFARKLNLPLVASFANMADSVTARNILPLAKFVKDEFKSGKYKKIVVAYTHYLSALSFLPIVSQVLPLNKQEIEDTIQKLFKNKVRSRQPKFYQYLFEPEENEVLNFILPKILEVKIYKMVLEARASEHSSRMMAMKNASENAESLIDDLLVSYNRARQDGITREISEISAGVGASSYR